MLLRPKQWGEPIASSYGYHLVWVHELKGQVLLAPGEVSDIIFRRLSNERRLLAVKVQIKKLLRDYQIGVLDQGKTWAALVLRE